MSKNRKHKKAAYQRRKTRAQKERAALRKKLDAQKARVEADAAKVQAESSSDDHSSFLCRAVRRMAKKGKGSQLPITKDPTKERRHDNLMWFRGIGAGSMAGAFALAGKEHFVFGDNLLLILAILLAFFIGAGLFVFSMWQRRLLMQKEALETLQALPAKAKKEAIAEARASTLFQERHKLMKSKTAFIRSQTEVGKSLVNLIRLLPKLIEALVDFICSAAVRNRAAAEKDVTEAAKNEVETEQLILKLERLKSKGQKPLN